MFITNAYAQAQSASPGFSMSNLVDYLPFVLMFVVLYFLMIRPQQKRQKEQRDMLNAIGKDDEVVTSGGILGKVVSVTDNVVTLEIANNVEVLIQKSAIVTLLPKGTLGSGQFGPVDKIPPSCCG